MSDLSFDKLNNMHFYGWKKGLKTGLYYLKMRPATDAIKFTVDMAKIADSTEATTKLFNRVDQKKELEDENLRKRDLNSVELHEEDLPEAKGRKKLVTVNPDSYQEEECLNCGS